MKKAKTNFEHFVDWQKNITELAKRGINRGLLAELQETGPKAYAEVEALNTLTDVQLNQYVNLWKEKNAIIKSREYDLLSQELGGTKMYNKETEALIQTLERFKDVEGVAKASHRRVLEQLEKYIDLVKLELELSMKRDKYRPYCTEIEDKAKTPTVKFFDELVSTLTNGENTSTNTVLEDRIIINAEKITIKTF